MAAVKSEVPRSRSYRCWHGLVGSVACSLVLYSQMSGVKEWSGGLGRYSVWVATETVVSRVRVLYSWMHLARVGETGRASCRLFRPAAWYPWGWRELQTGVCAAGSLQGCQYACECPRVRRMVESR